MTADEAQLLAKVYEISVQEEAKKSLEEIYNQIREAAKKGSYSLKIERRLSVESIRILLKDGFKVDILVDKGIELTFIIWTLPT